MKNTYTLEVTRAQAEIIGRACDLLSRVQSGQWPAAYGLLPKGNGVTWTQWHKVRDEIATLMKTIMGDDIDGVRSSYGVGSNKTPASADVSWDIHQVIRHRLAWDDAIQEGTVKSDGDPRDLRTMIGVAYDPPMNWGVEPLAKFRRNH